MGTVKRLRYSAASGVVYDGQRDRLELRMGAGWRLVIDRACINELKRVSPAAMKQLRLSPGGTVLHLDHRDIHIYVTGLLSAYMR